MDKDMSEKCRFCGEDVQKPDWFFPGVRTYLCKKRAEDLKFFVMHHVLEALVMLDIMVKTKGGYKINPEILSSSVQDQRKPSSVEYLEDLARPGHQRAWRKTTARILVP